MGTHFHARWSTKVWAITLGFVALAAFVGVRGGPPAAYAMFAVVLGTAAFMVRGYSVIDGKLLIHRLGWSTTFDLSELTAAEMLQFRVRYFTDGAVLGSRQFVDEIFARYQQRLGRKRRTGARPMRGADWQGLCVLRDLRLDIIAS